MPSPELTHYQTHGYAVVRGFIPTDVIASYRTFLEREYRLAVEHEYLREDANPLLRRGHFPLATRLSGTLFPLAQRLGQSELLRELLGSDVLRLHYPPMLRFVPPDHTIAAVPAHQDVLYNSWLPGFVTLWIPLVPITAECGGLTVYEGTNPYRSYYDGTNTYGLDVPGSDDTTIWLPAINTDEWTPVTLQPLTPGDVVLLSPTIVHASAPNNSNMVRFSMDLRLFTGASSKHYLDLQTMKVHATPEHVA